MIRNSIDYLNSQSVSSEIPICKNPVRSHALSLHKVPFFKEIPFLFLFKFRYSYMLKKFVPLRPVIHDFHNGGSPGRSGN